MLKRTSTVIPLFVILLVFCTNQLCSQEPQTVSASFLIGPDPALKYELFKLLRDRLVQHELQLTKDQVDGINRIYDDAQKTLRDLADGSRKSGTRIEPTALKDALDARRLIAEEAIEELILPSQMSRLRQIAFRIEVSRIGLGPSLAYGRLGSEAGIYTNQVNRLMLKWKHISERADNEIQKILERAEEELIGELTPEQRDRVTKNLGDHFQYSEHSFASQFSDFEAINAERKE